LTRRDNQHRYFALRDDVPTGHHHHRRDTVSLILIVAALSSSLTRYSGGRSEVSVPTAIVIPYASLTDFGSFFVSSWESMLGLPAEVISC